MLSRIRSCWRRVLKDMTAVNECAMLTAVQTDKERLGQGEAGSAKDTTGKNEGQKRAEVSQRPCTDT